MKTKKPVCDDESAVARKDVEIPPRKKLKQARLPFQILSPGVESSSPLLKSSNKRKLSDSADDTKIIKTVRPNDSGQLGETKENVCSPILSDDCKKSSDNASKTLPNPCAGKEVMGHANDSVNTSEISEIAIDLDENDSGGVVKGSFSKNEVDWKVKSNNSTREEEFKISQKKYSGGDVGPDVIILSDSEDNVVGEDLTNSSYKIMPTKAQSSLSKNETMDIKQDITYSSPATDSENSETENSPTVIKSSPDESIKSKKETSPSETCATNSESDIPNQLSPKSVDIKSKKYLLYDVRTPKSSSSQCSLSETSSKKNTADAGRTPEASLQNSLCDDNSEECTFNSETSPLSSIGSAQKIRKLTPKQLLKQLESAKKKEEKERQRQEREQKKAEEKEEREKKRAEEKEERQRQKLEKEEQKKKEKEEKEEQKRKEKEEREELKKKEKEEKERKKQVDLEMKNEEKRAKDEEKRKKEDKRQAEVAAFTSFFLPKKAELKPVEEPKAKVEENFMPFEVKADMRLAPSTRTKLTLELKQTLDQCIESQSEDQLYIDEIRIKKIIPQTSSSTWALSDFKDVVILDDYDISSNVADSIFESYPAAGKLPRPKLLQFWENRRPPYWGTWRKKSQSIGPKNPFSMDEKFFDYEVDSDDEWEEEEPGESLHGSDDEKESEDEYEVDNEFFVPHGYLSDEENVGQEDEDQSPEMLKIKLKVLELEFEEEMKQKTEHLRPSLFGCIWIDSKSSECADSQLLKLLSPYQAVYRDCPIVTSASDPASVTGSPESKNEVPTPTTPLLKKKKFPEAAIPALIKLIHGNVNKRVFLAKEFLAYWNKQQQRSTGEGMEEGSVEGNVSASPSFDIFKKSVSNKIKELATWIACPDTGPMNGRMCWYVLPETRSAHGLPDITLPNSWNYTFKPKRRESDIQVPTTSTALSGESNSKQLITKFTKKMSEVERKKQFDAALSAEETPDKRQGDGSSQLDNKSQEKLQFKSSSKSTPLFNTNEQHKKKVPILTSTPKGQELSRAYKNSLKKFMKPQSSIPDEGNKFVPSFLNIDRAVAPNTQNTGGEECIVLSD